jgi:hypothetical protein
MIEQAEPVGADDDLVHPKLRSCARDRLCRRSYLDVCGVGEPGFVEYGACAGQRLGAFVALKGADRRTVQKLRDVPAECRLNA